MFSAAGRRITAQSAFKPNASRDVRNRIQRFARGNTLLRNSAVGAFDEVSVEAGIVLGRWSWGSNFVDLDNDGWQDLLVANGYITTDDTGDL
ncbi:MAG: VCBS repeat-containing protein [Planctomycetota bacterium]